MTFCAAAAVAGGADTAAPSDPATQPASPAPSSPPAANGAVPVTPPAQPNGSQGTPAVVLDSQEYDGLLGKSVRAMNGDDLGRIIDVIVDREGRPRAAIIDFGGFLGVGSRKIAVDWRVLKFGNDGKADHVTLQLNRNQVRVSPEYKPGEPIVVLGASSPGATPEADIAPAAKPAETTADKPQEKTPDK